MRKHNAHIIVIILGLLMFGGAAYVAYKVFRHNTPTINKLSTPDSADTHIKN